MNSYDDLFARSIRLIGPSCQERLRRACVAVFGAGGVGSFAIEALCRAGIGRLILIDQDVVDQSNINRQLQATTKTIGQSKVELMKARALDINPEIQIETHAMFFLKPEDAYVLDTGCDYIIDAIDTVTGKLTLVECAVNRGIPIICSLGTGNKLDPTRFQIADIYQTSVCPLAKVMRHELRKRGIPRLDVLYSTEPPVSPLSPPGSLSFVPPVAGMILAGHVIRTLAGLTLSQRSS